jgi:tetratricopeptide (TPR) repeat protein
MLIKIQSPSVFCFEINLLSKNGGIRSVGYSIPIFPKKDDNHIIYIEQELYKLTLEELMDYKLITYSNIPNLLNDARNYHKNGEYTRSKKLYEIITTINPLCIEAWEGWGDSSYELKNFEDAKQSYNKALELNPFNSQIWEKLGSLYYETKEYEKAIYAFEKAIGSKPNEEILTKLASALEKVKKNNEIIANHKTKEINPNDYDIKKYKKSITYRKCSRTDKYSKKLLK